MSSGIGTLLAMLAFLGVVAWAYSRRRRDRFDEAARLPLEDDPPPNSPPPPEQASEPKEPRA